MKTKNDTLNAIQTMVNSAVEQAGYDKTRNAVIIARNSNNTYNIKMDGIEYDNVVFYGSGEVQVNEVVKVVIPNNQASQMYIMGKGGVIASDSNPIGSVVAFTGSNAPVGYLMCDGSAVSRETYIDLFAVIGTTYGSGDGSTTFNLPDFKEEKKTLLWTNSNKTVTSTYSGGDINIGKNILGYIGFEIVFRRFYNRQEVENAKYYRNQAIDSSMFAPIGAVDISGNIPQVSTALQVINYSRTFYRNGDDKIYVSDCKRQTNGTAPVTGQDTGVLVPIFIYGITQSVPIIKATHSVTIQGVDTMSEAEYQDLLERLDVI